jgi:ParB/RepB/Spo0J family partition protein
MISQAKFQSIPLASLDVAPQVRTKMEKDALAELAADMLTNGVLQPLLVRPLDNGRFRVIAGHRRAAAAHIAELADVPAIVKDATDEEALMMQLSEILHREDLSDVDTANAVRRLFDHFGTLDAVAAFTMKSRSWCSKYLSLTLDNFSWEARRMIEDGVTEDLEIVGIANQIQKVCGWDNRQVLVDFIANVKNGWTRDQCRTFLKTLKEQLAQKAEIDAAKAKLAAVKKKTNAAPKFKPADVLRTLYYDRDSSGLTAYTKEQLEQLVDLVRPLHAAGAADRERAAADLHKGQSITAAIWPYVINAYSVAREWQLLAYTAGLMGEQLTTLHAMIDRAFSFQTDSLVPPPAAAGDEKGAAKK